MLGEAAMAIEVGRLLTMRAAGKIDAGDKARKEVSMAKIQVADALHQRRRHRDPAPGRQGLLEGHAARVDVPLRPPGPAGRRRVRGAPDGGRARAAARRGRASSRGREPGSEAPAALPPTSRPGSRPGWRPRSARRTRASCTASGSRGGAIQENIGLYLDVAGGAARRPARPRAPDRRALGRGGELGPGAGVPHPRGRLAAPASRHPSPGRCARTRPSSASSFYLMRRMPGEARGFRLVRDPAVQAHGEELAAQLGRELAKLHRLAPPVPASTSCLCPTARRRWPASRNTAVTWTS